MTDHTTEALDNGTGFQPGRWLKDWLPALTLMLFILVARSTLADHYHVPSGSMEHSLIPGDHVLVDKSAYGLRFPFSRFEMTSGSEPERGEVVIFDSPVDGVRLIKRVVAVGGDLVAVRRGRVYIDGKPMASKQAAVEQYGQENVFLNLDNGGGPDLAPVRVPDGHVLVLGDHRGNSRDGRYFGFVPSSELYGRASRVFWRRSQGPAWESL